ncbi:MAG: transglycosylase family protein [Acidimicrobiales bacterium]
MSKSQIRGSAAVAVCLIASALSAAAASAQTSELSCFGITIPQARAAGYKVTIGTAGVDVMTGGNVTKDMFFGLGGDDVISGAGGNDIICGGEGNDIIVAGAGDDRVDGQGGSDDIDLQSGEDQGRGGAGNDRLVGGTGDDHLQGGIGADRLSGEDGVDVLLGGDGHDIIFGGPGNDRVVGGTGNDRIAGGPGRDKLRGARGNDIISGDDGRDRVIGGGGNDILDGDANADVLRGGPGNDRCDPTGGDRLVFCEMNLGGDSIVVSPPPGEEPGPDPDPPPGDAIPASEAPQGTNQFGWPFLTDVGLTALLQCESGVNHQINTGNGFYGAAQWVPATWTSAATQAGFSEWANTLPHLVPAEIQDVVTEWWWGHTRVNTQWPHCHVLAMEAMNILPPPG